MGTPEMPKGGWPEPQNEKMPPFGEKNLEIRDRAIMNGRDWTILKGNLEISLEQAEKVGNKEVAEDLKKQINNAEAKIAECLRIADFSEAEIIQFHRNKEFLSSVIEEVKGRERGGE